ncbi:RNA pseudouridine synthase [soil metagenome]
MIRDQILYEDNHLLVINKLAGQLSQGDETGDPSLADDLKAYIKEKYNKPGEVFLGVVHRLDRPTSGIILYARTSKALVRLNEMLRERTVKKTYWALVSNRPALEDNTLKHHLLKHGSNNTSVVVSPKHKLGKEAILHYTLIKSLKDRHLLEVSLETGRHHQIRVQLSSIGSPIIGDLKYGHRTANADKSICLHARRIEFIHPVQKTKMTFEAPLPQLEIWRGF